ncbi:MAG: hypothetical protein ACLTCA_05165 [Alistipes ihumii]
MKSLSPARRFYEQSGRSRYFYRTGIRPDRYVEETADDIRLGRDVALEEALRIAGAPPSAGNP